MIELHLDYSWITCRFMDNVGLPVDYRDYIGLPLDYVIQVVLYLLHWNNLF